MRDNSQWGFRLLLFVWLLQCFAYFQPGATWSPVSRLALTRAIAERGTFEIGAWGEATGDRARHDGRWYSDKAPFPSVVGVPAYAIYRAYQRLAGLPEPTFEAIESEGPWAPRVRVSPSFATLLFVCSVATSGVCGALLGVMLFELLRRRFPVRSALFATVLTVLGLPLFPYATSYFGHVPAACALLGAVLTLDAPPSTRPLLRHVAGGALLAASVGCEYLAALPGAAIGLWALARPLEAGPSRTRRLAGLAAGALGPVLLLGAYHAICFGAPWRTGYSFVVHPVFVAGHSAGWMGIGLPRLDALYGMFLGVRRGLFYVAPVALVGVVGVALRLRRARDGALWALVAGAVLLVLANAGYYMWWGGAGTGPRHLVPVLPLVAFGLAEAWRSPWSRRLAVGLGMLSVLHMTASTAVGLEAPEQVDALLGYAWPHLVRGELALTPGAGNLGLRLGLPPAASLSLLAVWMVLGLRALAQAAAALHGRLDMGASDMPESGMFDEPSPEQAT